MRLLCLYEVYRVTFQLKKCEFLTNRIEYVGHDITPNGNCPAQSKFDLITNWPLPATGQSLSSFISLVFFYNIYCPFFEIRVKPLRSLERAHHQKSIPDVSWTSSLVSLWNELKVSITMLPCLACYDSSKPCFFKMDWAGTGMGWILMKSDDLDASTVALALLHSEGTCNFDVTMNGARLHPIRFGSHSCTEHERHYHSFISEASCSRWAITRHLLQIQMYARIPVRMHFLSDHFPIRITHNLDIKTAIRRPRNNSYRYFNLHLLTSNREKYILIGINSNNWKTIRSKL